jgi:hypothetical protein
MANCVAFAKGKICISRLMDTQKNGIKCICTYTPNSIDTCELWLDGAFVSASTDKPACLHNGVAFERVIAGMIACPVKCLY